MTDLTDFDVTLKMARSTGPNPDDVEHRTFTARGPAVDAKHAEAIAYSLGHGINDASDYQWKFCGGPDAIVVQPAADEHMELNPTGTAEWLKNRVNELNAQVADLADKLHKANAEIDSHTKAGTAWANENQRLRRQVQNAKESTSAAADKVNGLLEYIDQTSYAPLAEDEVRGLAVDLTTVLAKLGHLPTEDETPDVVTVAVPGVSL